MDSVCLFCKKSELQGANLKPMQEKQWETAKQASLKRKLLKNDQYNDSTTAIQKSQTHEQYWYHSKCLSNYSAVKRKAEDDQLQKRPTKATRSQSSFGLSTSSTGVLGNGCVFCPFKRRRSSSSQMMAYESPRPISCRNSAAAIVAAAKQQDSEISHKILAIPGDLLAKEAKCHDSCKRDFIRAGPSKHEDTSEAASTRKKHSKAFEALSTFLQYEIIHKHKAFMASTIFNLYREEFLGVGGTLDEFSEYSVQSLLNKVKKISELQIDKESNKTGLFVFPKTMTLEEAKNQIMNSSSREEEIRCAAMAIRAEIGSLPKTKLPSPTTVHTIKETAPSIPPLTDLFFRTVMNGLNKSDAPETSERKITAMASDTIFNCSHGSVRPWKNTMLGLGLSSLTGSKTTITVLNRQGHAISYNTVKELETEIAYSCASGDQETPSGLVQSEILATATAWDNYDAAIETLDGKDTLHVTVGICYQNFDSALHSTVKNQGATGTSTGRARRSFIGPIKEIPPCHSNLKLATFQLDPAITTNLLSQDGTDFIWLVKSCMEKLPLSCGYYSLFVNDSLPKTVIAYMDPISQPPTRNDVVQETMVRSVKVAAENKQEYAIVSYDLAVALKAFSIQSMKAPDFDNLIILLGVFHLELALFGALGTYISDSGIEYILTEFGILADGSLNGLLKGKFYNRCTRIHQLVAAVMEKAMFQRYLEDAPEEIKQVCKDLLTVSDQFNLNQKAQSDEVKLAVDGFEVFFHKLINGAQGELARFWAIYVYIVNRIHRLLQRAVRTNDVDLFLRVLPCTIELFFALNRPNYARWGSLFLDKMKKMPRAARTVLEAGAFSIRRTKKSYSRSPIDLTLEQTVNRDAASSATGITSFANSDNTFRRWCVSLTQRSMAVSEMKDICNIHSGETPAKQLKKSNIKRDNREMEILTKALENTCNPFSKDAPHKLVNIATGKAATTKTSDYLTQVLERGKDLRNKFVDECVTDDKRFLKTIPRCQVLNFARENLRKKCPKEKNALGAAEGVRDAFGYLLTEVATSDAKPDLKMILSYPITEVPLSLAHSDGTMNNTEKAALTKILEEKQVKAPDEKSIGRVNATLFDGGLVMHEVLSKHNKSTYSSIARDFMVKLCSARGDEVHLLLDRYITPSIKDAERQKRGGVNEVAYQITGPDQQQNQKGAELLKDYCFKEEFGQFLLAELQKNHYGPIVGEKIIYISHGGTCISLKNISGQMKVTRPETLQGQHEEADTLIAFHLGNIEHGTVMVRSSDTDVVVILTSLAARKPDLSIFMDYGTSNNRRFINISMIAAELEKKQSGLCEALIGLHTLTGCDFTSSFYRKGKKKPFEILESDDGNQYLSGIQSLSTTDVDYQSVTAFVCHIYGMKDQQDINEVRYKSFMKMTGGRKVLSKVKRINCASLPPCSKSLYKHIQRANYVALMWRNADQGMPSVNSPLDFGWKEENGETLKSIWFEGHAMPDFGQDQSEANEVKELEDDELESGGEWSGDSGDSESDE